MFHRGGSQYQCIPATSDTPSPDAQEEPVSAAATIRILQLVIAVLLGIIFGLITGISSRSSGSALPVAMTAGLGGFLAATGTVIAVMSFTAL
jgi:hypothetical protein